MNARKKNDTGNKVQADAIAFGFDRDMDEQSLRLFLERFTDTEVMAALLPRLQNEDIAATVDFLTAILRKYLSEDEYHRLFLAE